MIARKVCPTSLAAVAVIILVASQVHAVPVTMSPYPTSGQTRIFRGNLAGLGVGTVYSATITDSGLLGGQTGVFSGCDIDFLLLDADGDLSTTGDQVLPMLASAVVTPGTIRTPTPYTATAAHPGILFGLNGGGTIDGAVSTLSVRDAWYDPYNMTVDGSGGFVTIGDSGELTVKFPTTAIGSGLWLFVGEVGLPGQGSTEVLGAGVEINPPVPAPGAVLLAGLGTILAGALRRRRVL